MEKQTILKDFSWLKPITSKEATRISIQTFLILINKMAPSHLFLHVYKFKNRDQTPNQPTLLSNFSPRTQVSSMLQQKIRMTRRCSVTEEVLRLIQSRMVKIHLICQAYHKQLKLIVYQFTTTQSKWRARGLLSLNQQLWAWRVIWSTMAAAQSAPSSHLVSIIQTVVSYQVFRKFNLQSQSIFSKTLHHWPTQATAILPVLISHRNHLLQLWIRTIVENHLDNLLIRSINLWESRQILLQLTW